MLTADQIPHEVVEAAARAAHQNWRESCSEASHEPITNWQEWDDLTYDEQCDWLSEARAAIAAALNAWPGMRLMEEQHSKTIQWVPWRIKEWKYRFLHLPLPKENSDG